MVFVVKCYLLWICGWYMIYFQNKCISSVIILILLNFSNWWLLMNIKSFHEFGPLEYYQETIELRTWNSRFNILMNGYKNHEKLNKVDVIFGETRSEINTKI